MISLLYRVINSLRCRWHHNAYMNYQKEQLGRCGKNVTIMPNCNFIPYHRVYIGENVYIGPSASFLTTEANIKIGNYVLFGPHVSIVTGNHRKDVIGEYMFNVKEKLPENDEDVTIEDDVWIGMNAMIFKGVVIGKGSIVAGGSVVTKNIPPYSIYCNNKILSRFSPEQINEHERLLNKKYGNT